MSFPSVVKLAYTAGIIDGEGSIVIYHSVERRGRAGRCTQMRVSVTNTDIGLINWLKEEYRGTIVKNKTWKTLQRKQCYSWVLVARQAGEFLKSILPYMKVRKPQAELALKFQSHKKRGGRVTTDQVLLEEMEWQMMSNLNRKGVN